MNYKLILVLIFMKLVGNIYGQSKVSYEVIRIDSAQPLITQAMFTELGVEEEGENINGPSIIRIPDWIVPENRANINARYYMYFGHHTGKYIRMAWASELAGPWELYHVGSDVEVGNRGVLDLGGDKIYLENGIVIPNNHLASPDAHVDDENQQIILYFHSGSSTYVNDQEVSAQVTYVSTSSTGLNFYDNIQPVILGSSYFRVFEYDKYMYSLKNDATPMRALDANDPWTAPDDFDFTEYLWEKHPDNPFAKDIIEDGYETSELRVRHTGVRVYGDELHVFYSRRGDAPERIQMSTIDLSVGDWELWDATYPPVELFSALEGWEGGQYAIEPSETSSAPENVNQLRDPYFFEDSDSLLYLFYTGCGEDAIGYVQVICHDSSLVEPVGVLSYVCPEPFKVYPNPNNGNFRIENKLMNTYSYQVYSLSGTIIYRNDNVSNFNENIDLSNIEKGIYFLILNSDKERISRKIVIQ
jgi:hypothetical protein